MCFVEVQHLSFKHFWPQLFETILNYHRFGILRNYIDSKLYNIEERERIEELDGEVKRREIYGFKKSLVPFQKEKEKEKEKEKRSLAHKGKG